MKKILALIMTAAVAVSSMAAMADDIEEEENTDESSSTSEGGYVEEPSTPVLTENKDNTTEKSDADKKDDSKKENNDLKDDSEVKKDDTETKDDSETKKDDTETKEDSETKKDDSEVKDDSEKKAENGTKTDTDKNNNSDEKSDSSKNDNDSKDGKLSYEDIKTLLEQRKDDFKKAKIQIKAYIKDIKELFKSATAESRKELLAEIAALKKQLNDTSIDTFVNGEEVDYDLYDGVKPVIENDRTLIPVRAVSEKLGAVVEWTEKTQTITITKDSTVIVMQLDSCTVSVNGNEETIDVAPKTVNDRTMVPIRFISEALNFNVDWDDASQTVIID